MKEETHSLKCVYKGVQPYIKVTAYELSAVNCSADKMSGYYGEEGVLISDDPNPGYNFSNWSVTGTTLTGNNFKFNGDVTAQANYSAIKYNVTLQNDGHGSIGANKTTGNIGDTITLSNTANAGYNFSGYSVTGANLTGNAFNIGTSNVTAKAWFSALPAYNLTLQTDGHGKISANKTTGYNGDTVTLSNTASAGYGFKNYTVTGATINGSTLTFGNGNATAKANYSAVTGGPFTARMVYSWNYHPSNYSNAVTFCPGSNTPTVTANFPTANIFSTQTARYTVRGSTYTATGYIFNRSHAINNFSASVTASGTNTYGSKSVFSFLPQSGVSFNKTINAGGNQTALITGTAAKIQNTAQPQYNIIDEIYPHLAFDDPDYEYANGLTAYATAVITGVLV